MFEDRVGSEQKEAMSYGSDVPAAVSDIGCEREINEDRYAVFRSGTESVWIVCDGMGGAVGGELAAQLAIDTIKRVLENAPDGFSHEVVGYALQEANRVVVLRRQNPAFENMGTTIVAAYIHGSAVSFFHAGDSRAYIVTDSSITQITSDHTYVQDLVSRGVISEEDALHHPQSHVLTRCLGGQLKINFEPQRFGLEKDALRRDKLLLCSDGLYSLLSDDEIRKFVLENPPQHACSEMVDVARRRGGFDNITVAVIPLEGILDVSKPFSPAESTRLQPAAKVLGSKQAAPTQRRKKKRAVWQKLFLLLVMAFFAAASVMYLVLMLLGN